jgi:pSer/pThr/pTyr-binding forkhead associated (FHA) protein
MDIASNDRHDGPEDLLVSFNGRRVIRRAADGEFIIGREVPPSHIQIDHPAISRLHIRLVPGARWALIDYDSRNGVYLNGRRIAYETPITDCMTVHLGAPGGIPVAFHYIATEQHAPIAAGDEADPDITEVITPDLRRVLLIDSATLTLAAIASAIAKLPPPGNPRFEHLAEPVRQRLGALQNSLRTAGLQSDAVDMLHTIARVYARRLVTESANQPRA